MSSPQVPGFHLDTARAQAPGHGPASHGIDTLRSVTDTAAAHDLSDPSTDPFAVADAAAADIRERTGVERHDVALVLGSGWGQTGDLIGETLATIENTDVPGFGKAAVAGHSGVMRSVAIGDTGRRALVYGTRTHYYEGRGVRAVVHGIRTAAAAGCRTVVITNGCGGLRPEWAPGTPVLISDHINLTATSPIEGANFVDLTDVYSPRLRAIAKEIDPRLDEGVYVQFRGPHYETPAEVRMAGILGGDLVGMSTSLEAIAARQSGLEVLGISLVTNPAAGISKTPLNHEEVLEAGREAADRCGRLLAAVVGRI
jgi:purine-nucleoside phosphorylase